MGRGELLTRLRGFLAMFWGLAQECPQIGPWLPCHSPGEFSNLITSIITSASKMITY